MKSTARNHARGIAVPLVLGVLSVTMVLAFALSRSATVSYKLSYQADYMAKAKRAAERAAAIALVRLHDNPDWMPKRNPFRGRLPGGEEYQVEVVTTNEGNGRRIISQAWIEDPKTMQQTARQELFIELKRQVTNNYPTGAAYSWSGRSNPDIVEDGIHIGGDLFIGGVLQTTIPPQILGAVHGLHTDFIRPSVSEKIYREYQAPWGDRFQAQELAQFSRSVSLGCVACGLDDPLQSADPVANFRFGTWSIVPEQGDTALPQEVELLDQAVSNSLDLLNGGVLHIRDVNLGPSPANPMGVFRHIGDVIIEDDVQISGTLAVKGTVTFRGSNTRLRSIVYTVNPDSELVPGGFPILAVDGPIVFEEAAENVRIAGVIVASGRLTCRRPAQGQAADPQDADEADDQNSQPLRQLIQSLIRDAAARSGASPEPDPGPSVSDLGFSPPDDSPRPLRRMRRRVIRAFEAETSDIMIRGTIFAKGIELRHGSSRRFVLVHDPSRTKVSTAPSFFTWRVDQWNTSDD